MNDTNRRGLVIVAVVSVTVVGLLSIQQQFFMPAVTDAKHPMVNGPAESSISTATATGTSPVLNVQDLVGHDPTLIDDCTLVTTTWLRFGDTGVDVICVQQALTAEGLLSGEMSGQFDDATRNAVRSLQGQRNLFVDGVVGRETALSLGIWPDENLTVVRTPPPASGAVDLLGYRLSSVASAGSDAPPLPPDSGSGRRLVYERSGQRIWAVDEDGTVIRSWLISGSKYNNETPGQHKVYSRSIKSTAWNGKAWLPKMVRWLKTDLGALGFHSIPLHVEDDSPYQTETELGTRLSGGCQRQAPLDAEFTWDFAQIGTIVVVL